MNLRIQPQRTPAETALLATYAQLRASLPGDGRVRERREAALLRLEAGLPTRRLEEWHYTDLRRLLTDVPAAGHYILADAVAPLIEGSSVLALRNGRSSEPGFAVPGVVVERLTRKLEDGSFAGAMSLRDDSDLVGAINAALVADGYFVNIADGTMVAAPIELQNVHGGGQAHVRLPVRVGAGVKATIVERQTGTGAALVSSISHLLVGEGSYINWILVQDQPDDVAYFGQFNAELGRNAKLTLFVMNAGGKLVRQEVRVAAKGEGAEFKLRGVNLLSGAGHTDLSMMLDHAVPGTSSSEIVRNVVTDRARGVFQGRIVVAKHAQKTDAKMACNTLLLSDEGEFSAKPELEIFADDVQCGHGATVAEIDADHLFYLMARGIDEKTARGLLVKAFLATVIEELEDEPIVAALEARLEAWFARHG